MLLGLGAGARADECSHTAVLPPDATVTPPAVDVPADVARFSGVWGGGRWTDRAGRRGQCTTLVVEEVLAGGYARLVYAVGTVDPSVLQPRSWRVGGRVVDGVLRFELAAVPTRPRFTWRFDGAHLAGTTGEAGQERLIVAATRLPDLRQAACPRLPRVTAPSAGVRDRILAAELLSAAFGPTGPVHNEYFMPMGAAAPARHTLRGTLSIPDLRPQGAHQGCAGLTAPALGISAAFLTHGEHLVPAVRGILATSNPTYGVILSPGRVWSEPGDGGMSRASFPFVAVNRYDNGTHNGLATFLFDDARVSSVRVQFTQETYRWARDDYWGQAAMTYAPGAVPDEARVRAELDAERRLETPMQPWSALPAASPWLGDAFDGSAARDDVSTSGLVIDGVLHVKACHTRTGPYPYCRHMRHAAQSVTKTLGAGIALLRLAAKYGDGVFDEKIADHVRVTAAHDGWADVTFGDALDMVAPIGEAAPGRDSPQIDPDDNTAKFFEWMQTLSAQDKLARGFAVGRYPWARREVVRYSTSVTFTLAAAMDAYLKRKAGPDADLWDMVVEEVYRPIGILHAPTMRTVEPDGRRGLPILGFGLTPTVDDVAKLATLLQQRGRHDGVQLLHAAKIDEVLGGTAIGLSTRVATRFGERRYHRSFWLEPYRTAAGCALHVPFMWGYGGNFVVLLPNGVSAFRFADGHVHDLETMILAGEAIRPFCATPPAPAATLTPAPLTAAELHAELPGHTFGTGPLRVFIAPDGRQYLVSGATIDVGRWRVTPEGLYCRTWHAADDGRERCHHVLRDGETFTFQVHDRWTVFRWTRTRGRAPGL